ncbi:MAG: DUF86 domain-containing protein [Methanoregula sp.]|jgi:uncharacterized protein with HEPN domain|nr:DUF86 domain-containing protein [Methanoregula sp.]
MKGRHISILLKEILDNINRIRQLTNAVTYEELLDDDTKYIAIVECIKKISAAVEQIPTIVRVKQTLIPWTALAGLTGAISRPDLGTSPETVWKIATEYLPGLKPRIEQMYDEFST